MNGETRPVLSVSLGLWQDRPPAEVLRTAQVADSLGYPEIWIGEMATFDAFALGAVVAERTERAALTIGDKGIIPQRVRRKLGWSSHGVGAHARRMLQSPNGCSKVRR